MGVGGNHYGGNGLAGQMSQYGAVIYSSQWVGWVPGNCGGDGNLQASSFTVTDVKIRGRVVQGPEPTRCSPTPPAPPSPPSPPSPPTPPSGTCTSSPGMNNGGVNLKQASGVNDAGACCDACTATSGCVGYTFVKRGGDGSPPECWLKSSVDALTPDPYVVSGTIGGPSPVPPSPPTPPSPSADWCPSAGDFTVAYGSPQLQDGGWTIHGNGGAATKAAYNLLGGYVEFDVDFSGVTPGVNANIYTISPSIGGGGYQGGNYCDGAVNDRPWCLEVDWIESNGNCGGATTLHTKAGNGPDGCTAWGCRASYHYNGRTSFHMRIEYGTDGSWTTIRDGQTINAGSLSPQPGSFDWGVIKSSYESKGALIYSSEWQGWVPVQDCGTSGDLPGSHFTVRNLKVKGAVVQGPTPRSCTGSTRNATVIV